MKPQPLDLKNLKIFTYLKKDNEIIRNEIKQHIKSACEFYLRYKDNPELLVKEHHEYENVKISTTIGTLKNFIKIRKMDTGGEIDETLLEERDYNEWLFKLTFKDVLNHNKTK